jgi:hypothetical protein
VFAQRSSVGIEESLFGLLPRQSSMVVAPRTLSPEKEDRRLSLPGKMKEGG